MVHHGPVRCLPARRTTVPWGVSAVAGDRRVMRMITFGMGAFVLAVLGVMML